MDLGMTLLVYNLIRTAMPEKSARGSSTSPLPSPATA